MRVRKHEISFIESKIIAILHPKPCTHPKAWNLKMIFRLFRNAQHDRIFEYYSSVLRRYRK
ncbi:hypothetical protein [Helicobacter bilis]|uniref:Uncharacterized protein n=1 Tax=Helicobacter bilis TaxID=37372 RepID=A0A4U8U964_9HELI|nr:hypothetical protein [Helicobacter bilis]TLE10666.1 hypothetical protein LS79_005215 [Helicobacter bilis]